MSVRDLHPVAKGASRGNRIPKLMHRKENVRSCFTKTQQQQVRGEVKDHFPGQPVADTIYDTFTSLYDKDKNPSASKTADIVGDIHNGDGDHSDDDDDDGDDGKGHSSDHDKEGDVSRKHQRAEVKPPSVHTGDDSDHDSDDDDDDHGKDYLQQVTDDIEDVAGHKNSESPCHSEPCHSHDSNHGKPV